jgi:hypothetical protein
VEPSSLVLSLQQQALKRNHFWLHSLPETTVIVMVMKKTK